jgi:site-specific DNA-adenine methylase
MKQKRNFTPVPTLFSEFVMPKIRTYRIPYTGSKNAIAPQIIGAILTNTSGHGNRRFVDAFCGGGAILYGVQQCRMFGAILGNDLNSEMIELHRNLPDLNLEYIARTPCILRPNAVLQAKYPHVKLINEIEPQYQMAFKITYSFGNDCQTNMWGDKMIIKYELSRILFDDPDLMAQAISDFVETDVVIPFTYTANGLVKRYEQYKQHVGMYRKQLGQLGQLGRLQQLQQLEQLERLQQLQQLQQLGRLGRLEFTSQSYSQIEYRLNDVIYFDPPYRSTLDGKGYHGIDFDNDTFEDFARSLKCPVFISEYVEKIEGFQPLLRIGKLATMKNKGSSKESKQRYEYLHWNGIR